MKFYHWFIPNKKNKFHPIALRTTGLIVFLAIFLTIPMAYNITTAKQFRVLGYATNVNISDLYSLSNQERANNGLPALNLNSTLNSAALAKANHMMVNNYWAHIAPDGTTPWYFITAAGYQYTSAGENLAKDFSTSSGVTTGWMGSPTHRANVLSSSYQDVGYAVVNGVLQGSETTLVVAMYGARTEPVVAAAPVETTSQPKATPVQTAAPAQPAAAEPAIESAKEVTTATPVTTAQQPTTAIANKKTTDIKSDGVKAVKATNTDDSKKGIVEGISASLPVRTYNELNWGQKVSILLTSALILLFAMKHTLIWREQKRGLRHIWLRSHPLGQIAILTAVLVVTLVSGTGVIL